MNAHLVCNLHDRRLDGHNAAAKDSAGSGQYSTVFRFHSEENRKPQYPRSEIIGAPRSCKNRKS
jgi:hypothetical protein